eukprot:7609123-Karenia_brevis.AAC.1
MEICYGSGELTTHLRNIIGFNAEGYEHEWNQYSLIIKAIDIDISTQEGQEQMWKLLAQPNAKYIHMGPRCVTFQRSREKPLPADQKARG